MGNNISMLELVAKHSSPNTLSYIPLLPLHSQLQLKTLDITKLPPTRSALPPTLPPCTDASYCNTATAHTTQKRPPPVEPSPAKKREAFPAENYGLPKELGECIHRYVKLLKRLV